MKVIGVHKLTKIEITLEEHLTENQAWSFCEMWGWVYVDENGVSWWLEIKEDDEE